ncbi:hypothetical protein HAX54_053302, partial [Datura stramonium]|nr:hypothetical protein [Datura stramonium]
LYEKVKEAGSSAASVVPSGDGDNPSGKPRSVSIVVPTVGGGTIITTTCNAILSAPALEGSLLLRLGVDSGVASATPIYQFMSV